MNKPKFIFAVVALSLIQLSSLSTSFAQENKPPEPSYEIVLQTLTAAEDAKSQNVVPANLSKVVKKLKETFPFSNYQLTSTYLGRIENGGSFEYKSVSRDFADANTASPSFNEWTLSGVRRNAQSPNNVIVINSFRFGVRLPIAASLNRDETSKGSTVFNYELVGFTIGKFNLIENKPALLGTLHLANENQMAFVIMTIREVE